MAILGPDSESISRYSSSVYNTMTEEQTREEPPETMNEEDDNFSERSIAQPLRPINKAPTRSRFGTLRKKASLKHNPLAGRLSSMVHHKDQKQQITFETERKVYFNQPLPSEAVEPGTNIPLVSYPRNKVSTTKYTPLTFIPKNLFHQYQNIANIYFTFIVILGAFAIFGVADPGLAAVPIIVIVVVTAVRDAIEDSSRLRQDSELNNSMARRLVGINNENVLLDQVSLWRRFKKFLSHGMADMWVSMKFAFKSKKDGSKAKVPRTSTELTAVHSRSTWRTSMSDGMSVADLANYDRDVHGSVIDNSLQAYGDAKFKKSFWKNVVVGDILMLKGDEELPADVVVLATSDEDGACYIETKNLDGETNLKVRQSLRATSTIRTPRDLERARFEIDAEAPNPALYSFNGVLNWHEDGVTRSEPININNLLLRGCFLKNTKWVIGIVVYTGSQTKIVLNSGETPAKRSRLLKDLNWNIILNLLLVILLSFVAGLMDGLRTRGDNTSRYLFEYGSPTGNAALDGFVNFWASVILLQNLIPISLYISIEIVKTIQASLIYSDVRMYYEPLDYPCYPRAWNISDDLGQIEYVFSDKTGTLTQNVMEFRKCTVAGKPYGAALTEAQLGMMRREGKDESEVLRIKSAIEEEKRAMIDKLRKDYDNKYVDNWDELTFVSTDFAEQIISRKEKGHFFLLTLALCHAVLPETQDGKLILKAQSPDEEALVTFAKEMGYAAVSRKRSSLILNVHGHEEEYQVLSTLEFNSTRKRMSVIVRFPDGVIHLICKGADSVIFSRLAPGNEEMKKATARDLGEFAEEGLRTLCMADKVISEKDYLEWEKKNDMASKLLVNREEAMEEVADSIERGLTLIGGTAIEDKLQEGVPDTIELLRKAGIKVWVLTGDKTETAINIGFSCNLLDNSLELLIVENGKEISTILYEKFNQSGTDQEISEAMKDHSPPTSNYALIIAGDALKQVMDDETISRQFVLLGKQCQSVVCCRVSPAQKGEVVSLIRNTLDVMTLAIGDGANDVTMIQKADIGVGIAGVEGRQAVMSSDYAIAQFRFLQRLLLVHGKWSYIRISGLTANLFYKNAVFTLTLFWYDIYNSFTGSYLFDYTYITLFNLAFTSLPVIFMGFSDQDVNDRISLAVPQLYRRGIMRKEWSQTKFYFYLLDGIYESLICFFFSYLMFHTGGFVTQVGNQINYREAFGVFSATSTIMACNITVMLDQQNWDWLFILIVAISCLLVFFWTGIYTAFLSSAGFYKAAPEIYGALSFWAFLLLALIVCVLPRFIYHAYQRMFMPNDVDIIRERILMHQYDHLMDDGFDTSPFDKHPKHPKVDVDEQQDNGAKHLSKDSDDSTAMSSTKPTEV